MFYRYPGLCSDLEPAQLYWNHTGRHCESCRKISAVRIFSSNSTFESCCHRWREVEQRWMSPQMSRRLHALLAAPLLLMSCLSNFYFFCGAQVIFGLHIFRGGICHSRHCRRQCKLSASGVNLSRKQHIRSHNPHKN